MPKPRRIPAFNLNEALTRDLDEIPFLYGKYQGMTPLWVASHDPSYIIWFAETVDPSRIPFTKDLYELCKLTHAGEEAEDDPSLKELDGHLNFHK